MDLHEQGQQGEAWFPKSGIFLCWPSSSPCCSFPGLCCCLAPESEAFDLAAADNTSRGKSLSPLLLSPLYFCKHPQRFCEQQERFLLHRTQFVEWKNAILQNPWLNREKGNSSKSMAESLSPSCGVLN
jgi:hypothetical protein